MSRYEDKGFTLIEVMIVVVIVALLASIALPSYESYMLKTRRATAATCLLEISQFMERFFTKNLQYDKDANGNDIVMPSAATQECQSALSGYYDFASTVAPRTYSLRAVPINGQTRDTLCATLSIDETLRKSASGTASSDPSACWK